MVFTYLAVFSWINIDIIEIYEKYYFKLALP